MDQQASPTVAVADIEATERVLGVTQSAAERRLSTAAIAGQIGLARARRALALDDGLAPACVFDPRLPGFSMPDPGPLLVPADQRGLPGDDATIAFAPVVVQTGWIRAGHLSATRLTRICLERIERLDPVLRAFARLNPHALDEAAMLDARAARGDWAGPLHGIPYACKDIIDTAGLVTDWGAEPYRGRMPSADALVVTRLRAAGAILLGKSSVGALAYGDIWFGGRTRNPWNLVEGSSGSSAGSAAATATGMCGFALGTETLGSIVAPATRCGVVGLRPTFGRIARTGTMPLCPSLDKIGPICRGVEDTALVLAVLNGADESDPASIPATFGGNVGRDPAGLRVGWFPADFADSTVSDAERAVLDHCRALGAVLLERHRPDLPYASLNAILMAEAAAQFESLTLSDRDDLLTRQDEAAWPNQFRAARFLSAVDHIQLDRLRRRVMGVMRDAFDGIDVLIGPSLAGPMLGITNFSGHPCLCLPAGFIDSPARPSAGVPASPCGPATPPRKVPQSISLWANLFDEAPMLALGRALALRLALDLRPPQPVTGRRPAR